MATLSPSIRAFLEEPDETRRLGPYRCIALVGKGGFAPVCRAVEEHAGVSLREVAVKLFDIGRLGESGTAGSTEDWQARVADEARSLCRVQHPNVVRFHTLYTDAERGLMGLVMEYAQGVPLDRQLDELPAGDPRRVGLAVEMGIAVASALAAAHQSGIVHCDVKPPNVMLTEGTYKLIDFGIASTERRGVAPPPCRDEPRVVLVDGLPINTGDSTESIVVAESSDSARTPIRGTTGYIDPVCLRAAAPPTAASDLYALGATLYQCLTGFVPAVATPKHHGGSGLDSGVLMGFAPAAPIADVAPLTPPLLARLIDSLVEPEREDRPRSADAVARTLERVRSALAGRKRSLPDEARGPFRGLERFEARDRDVYFGRSAEVAGVVELLRQRGLVAVVGESGTGKSSLLRAGVLPATEEGALGGWPKEYRSVLLNPGTDPLDALREALSPVLGAPVARHADQIAQQLAAHVDACGVGVVIVMDQLEELVTLHAEGGERGRSVVLELLSRMADSPSPGVRAIVTARRDLLDAILALDADFSRSLSRGMQFLAPLSDAAWEDVVDQALEAYGYRLEDAALRDELVGDLRGKGSAMPLVQFALTRLWAERDEKAKTIPRASYRAVGGVRGALEQHADETVAALGEASSALQGVLVAMTTPQGTRAHVSLDVLTERFGESVPRTIVALMEARLVTRESAGITLVHESLLREWTLLRGWLEEARGDRLLAEEIERDSARWAESGDGADLWRKRRLSAAHELQKQDRVPQSEGARQFVRAALRQERKGRLAIGLVTFAIVAMVVGGALWNAKTSSARAAEAATYASVLKLKETAARKSEEDAKANAVKARANEDKAITLQLQIDGEMKAYKAKSDRTIDDVNAALARGDLDGARRAAEQLKSTTQSAPDPIGAAARRPGSASKYDGKPPF